jgi:hypothetical protein
MADFGFLSDEHRLAQGAAGLLLRAATLLKDCGTAEVFAAANLLALVAFRAGRVDDAKHLCRREIAHALTQRGTVDWPTYVQFALQPQVNLLRIQGYTGQFGEALVGLAQLSPIGDGKGADLPEFSVDEDVVQRLVCQGTRIDTVARNVVIHDTCKILWRHRRHNDLLTESNRLVELWGQVDQRGTVQHAAEAPWLVDALARPEIRIDLLEHRSSRVRRVTYVRLLHLVAHRTAAGQISAARTLAMTLSHRRDAFKGTFASPTTPLRWLAYLAQSLMLLGLTGAALSILREVSRASETATDPHLDNVVRALQGREPREKTAEVTTGLDDLLDAAHRRLKD